MTRLLVRATVAALLALAAGAAAAKPLYITVNRAYGTGERPVVDVAFERRGPVELRILRPDSLDDFVAKQANLRRAYQAPETKVNPGRLLSRGLNALRLPGTFVYRALGEDYRRDVAPALPKRPEAPPSDRPLARLAEGPERLVGLPPGTTLVRRTWLNLDLGGADRDYTVPGFDPYFGHASGWEDRRVELDPLPAGLYVVQLVQGRIEGQVVLVVTDLRVQVKQTDGEALVRVARGDLAPLAGAEISVRSATGEGPRVRTDAKGEARFRAREPRLLVVARSGADVAVVDTDFYSTLAASPDVFVYTDRPIYRPGDLVQFRGVVRQPDAFLARLFTPRSRDVSIALAVAEGREVRVRARVDEFGAFSGALAVPDDAATGVIRLSAELDERPHQAEARVQEYVKPTFYLEVLGEAETVRPGERLRAKVRARRYAGGAPEGTRYEVFLHRALLDSPAWVDDAGLGAQGSAVTYGSPSTTEGRLSVPERIHSSVEARGQQYAEDPWATAPLLDANGEAEIEVPVPALEAGDERFPWRYTLSVRARDDQGTFANGARPYYLAPSEVLGTVRPGAVVALAGGEAPLAIRSARLSGAPFPQARGTVEFVLRTASGEERKIGGAPFTTGADGVWRGKMPAPEAGTVIARVTLKDGQGRPWTGEGSLLVVKTGAESVRVPALQLASRGAPVAPGEQAELVVLFPSGWGPAGKDRGRVWVTLSGTGIFETRVVEAEGLSLVHRFPVERRFGSAVYAAIAYPTASGRWEERSVPFRIVPPERVLAVAVSPERPEAEPLGPQTLALRVTDHLGRGVRAQVSIGVVDKAIYALQGEFRPRILDFFYPLVRDNVATFTSAEFQGYGYGEALARALGRSGTAFAAVKPPTRTREVDTAYWNPSVATDEDGRATVTFALPSNQTLWTVTAVAVDASGRFGEGAGEFASRGGTMVVASLPAFLRAGDRATGSVRVARGEKGKDEKLELTVAVEGGLSGAGASASLSLAARAERIVPVELEAKGPGAGLVRVALAGGERALLDRREVPLRTADVEETVEVASFGGGRLPLDLPAGATVEEVELSLRPSTVALALAQVEELLTYPFGCLEQLVATTIPNVALHRVLEATGADDALDPSARALLSEARSRAVQGTERILALARPGGGFTWFAGGGPPSVPLTLIALDGLSHAIEAGLVSRNDPRVVESARWLEDQEGLPLPLDATRAYVLARLDGPRQAVRVRALLDRVAGAAPSDLHPVALAALAAERAGILGEPLVKARVDEAAARARAALARTADLRFDADAYWAYPLRRAGLTAILAHAASLSQVDLAVARRRIAEALSGPGALTTFERSTAILHSLWLIERDAREMKVANPPQVKVEGGEAPRLAARGAGLAAALARTTRAVTVAPFEGQAVLRARVRLPLSRVEARAEGMAVERTYFRLLPGGERRRLSPGDAVAQGEEVFVELRVDAHEGEPWRSLRSAYYVLQDPVPAGFVPLGEDKEYRGEPYGLPLAHEALKRRSLSPERAVFFFEEPAPWSRSPRGVGYVVRATFPGTFSAPPATVEDMYAPRVRGRSAPASLEIRPSAASSR